MQTKKTQIMLTELPQAITYNVVSFLEHNDLVAIRKINPELKLAADTFGSLRMIRMTVQRYLSPSPACDVAKKRLVARHVRPNYETLTAVQGIRVLAVEYWENDFGNPDLVFMQSKVYYLDSKGKVYNSTRGFWFSNDIASIEKDNNPFDLIPYLGDFVLPCGNHDGSYHGGTPCERSDIQ
jgi:hypothetical protein